MLWRGFLLPLENFSKLLLIIVRDMVGVGSNAKEALMNNPARKPETTSPIIRQLAAPHRLDRLHAVAGRFVHALRLIALHERARRDPVPELAARLGGVEIAAKALAVSQTIAATWPEDIHVSRFCCPFLTHDEVTIAALVESAWERNSEAFERQIAGLVRPQRVALLWDDIAGLVAAEASAR